MIGSAAIFGENCVDLVTAAWNTKVEDFYLEEVPREYGENPDGSKFLQNQCFQYLNPDDKFSVIAFQEKEAHRIQLMSLEETNV